MKSKKDLIETIQLITSLIALGMTLYGLVKRFMDWSERFDYEREDTRPSNSRIN